MGEKAIPKVQRKNRFIAGDASDQVFLEGLYGAVSRVRLEQVGGVQAGAIFLMSHIILEAAWTFIVNNLELGEKAPIGELGVEDKVGLDELLFTS